MEDRDFVVRIVMDPDLGAHKMSRAGCGGIGKRLPFQATVARDSQFLGQAVLKRAEGALRPAARLGLRTRVNGIYEVREG